MNSKSHFPNPEHHFACQQRKDNRHRGALMHSCRKLFSRFRIPSFSLLLCFLSPCFLYPGSKPNICLVMCVENHADVIENRLENVSKLVDCISICDLGSEDKTLEIISKFMDANNIPGQIHSYPSKNFEFNRTQAFQNAQDMLRHLEFSLENSYVLILDPDMQLHISAFFNKESLKEDAYLILEQSVPLGVCTYHLHLLRASLPWKSLGIGKESWSCLESYSQEKLGTITIEEPEILMKQLEKKAQQLFQALKKDPQNNRHLFHLAQLQFALKQSIESIKYFQKCLSVLQDKEEIWLCKFMIGQSYEHTGAWEQALYWYLEAFQSNPDRAESLQKIAHYYRLQGRNDLAYLFAKHGSWIPSNSNVEYSLFPPFSSNELLEEISIAGYYTRFKEDAERANLQLMLHKNVPERIKSQAYRNHIFYLHPLANAHYLPIELDLPPIQEGLEEQYHPMNPTIHKTTEGFQVICRAVNYTQKGAKIFHTNDPTGVFRTKNFLAHYDRDLRLLSQSEILENLPRQRYRAFNVEGLDDCRLFEFENELWFTCTTNDTNPTGNFQISLCQLGTPYTDPTIFVDKLTPLLGPNPYRCEKNWLPFVYEGQIHAIYSYDPFLIYRINPKTGLCNPIIPPAPELDLSRFRGSAPPISWEKGYLLLVHEVLFQEDHERIYMHRFVTLDNNLNMTKMSDPFYFLHAGVEFCCGMVIDHALDSLILTIGVEDHDAYFCQVPLSTIDSLLTPLSSLGLQP